MYNPQYWIVFLILGIRAVGSVFHTPAIQALIPKLVPTEELMRANGWNQFMQSGAYMLGPVIGGIMYGALSMPIILLTDLIGAIIASISAFVVKIEEDKKTLPENSIIYFWIFAVVCMFMGVGSNFYGIPLISYMQETIKPELMGRAFSLWGTILSITMPIGLVISGPVSEKYGISFWFLISGIVITGITMLNYSKIRKSINK